VAAGYLLQVESWRAMRDISSVNLPEGVIN